MRKLGNFGALRESCGRLPGLWTGVLSGAVLGTLVLWTLLSPSSWANSDSVVLGLSEGRIVRLKQSSNPARNLALAKFVKEPLLNPLQNPLGCPTQEPWVRLEAAGGYDSGRLPLPCDRWKGSLSNLTLFTKTGITLPSGL